MKKLLMLLMVISTSLMCAATVDWGFNGDLPSTQTISAGNKAVLFATLSSNGDVYSTLFNALKTNDNSVLTAYTKATASVVDNPLFGPMVATSDTFDNIQTDVGSAGTYNFYVAIFNANAPAEGDWFILTDAKTAETSTETLVTTLVFDRASADGWTQITGSTPDPGVPEPTVLALLALGVAGLTLKRKHF